MLVPVLLLHLLPDRLARTPPAAPASVRHAHPQNWLQELSDPHFQPGGGELESGGAPPTRQDAIVKMDFAELGSIHLPVKGSDGPGDGGALTNASLPSSAVARWASSSKGVAASLSSTILILEKSASLSTAEAEWHG